MIITINTHNSSRDEVKELKSYLNNESWDFSTPRPKSKNYTLSEDAINGTSIADEVREDEMHEFYIAERDDYISTLILWASEATKDYNSIVKDLKMLLSWEDEYILVSNRTNSYLQSSSPKFDEVCAEILEINSEVSKQRTWKILK